jgi:hypothetical protein
MMTRRNGKLGRKGADQPETVWKEKTMQNHISTSVLYEGHLYGFSEQRLGCIDFKTAKVMWDKTGLGRGSLIIADGQLIILSDHGELVLAKATPDKYVEVSRCLILDKEKLSWSLPVLSEGRLFVRTENTLVALDFTAKGK